MKAIDELVTTVGRADRLRPQAGGGQAGAAVRARNARVRGQVASVKNGKPMPWGRLESKLFMLLLEADPEVRSYERHPETVRVLVDGKVRPHTVAFAVSGAGWRVLVDIEPTHRPPSPALLDAVRAHFADRGVPYTTVSPAEIRAQPRLAIVQSFLELRSVRPPEPFLLAVAAAVGNGARTVGELAEVLADWPDARMLIGAAAVRGHLRLDLTAPLSDATALVR
ncbi:hypothetical protein [Azospirillum argentinense]